MTAVKIKNLNASYGEKQVLKDINLDIEEKQVTAIIGPSGCGKSTLLRCINRMNDFIEVFHASGEIDIDGKDVMQMDPVMLRKQVGMVFQKPNPFPKTIF